MKPPLVRHMLEKCLKGKVHLTTSIFNETIEYWTDKQQEYQTQLCKSIFCMWDKNTDILAIPHSATTCLLDKKQSF